MPQLIEEIKYSVRMETYEDTLCWFDIALAVRIHRTNRMPQKESENAIRAHIEGLHSDRGQVVCAVFAAADDFPKRIDRAFARTTAQIMSGSATCEFPRVPPGVYAVSVFHDENLNGRLDSNWLGIPREGVGASNNPKPRMGPPKFEAAEFQHSGASLDVEIIMHYL